MIPSRHGIVIAAYLIFQQNMIIHKYDYSGYHKLPLILFINMIILDIRRTDGLEMSEMQSTFISGRIKVHLSILNLGPHMHMISIEN